MENELDTYKHISGKIYTTTYDDKYLKNKVKENKAYMKCVLFRQGCRATAKLNMSTNLITRIVNHNHTSSEYDSQSYKLKSKCKSIDKSSHENLSKVFDDLTREDPAACHLKNANLRCIDRGELHNQLFQLLLCFHILSTFTFLESPKTLPVAEEIKKVLQKEMDRTHPEELSIFDAHDSTNNGAECFHSKLKR